MRCRLRTLATQCASYEVAGPEGEELQLTVADRHGWFEGGAAWKNEHLERVGVGAGVVTMECEGFLFVSLICAGT